MSPRPSELIVMHRSPPQKESEVLVAPNRPSFVLVNVALIRPAIAFVSLRGTNPAILYICLVCMALIQPSFVFVWFPLLDSGRTFFPGVAIPTHTMILKPRMAAARTMLLWFPSNLNDRMIPVDS